jgi:hypothetical protein
VDESEVVDGWERVGPDGVFVVAAPEMRLVQEHLEMSSKRGLKRLESGLEEKSIREFETKSDQVINHERGNRS